ncbi:MAG: hypothetical protein ACLSHB_00180 [Bacteroides thetaiotaomicron]
MLIEPDIHYRLIIASLELSPYSLIWVVELSGLIHASYWIDQTSQTNPIVGLTLEA